MAVLANFHFLIKYFGRSSIQLLSIDRSLVIPRLLVLPLAQLGSTILSTTPTMQWWLVLAVLV
jgi:hypothetical protein